MNTPPWPGWRVDRLQAALNGPLYHEHPGNDRQTIDQGYGPKDPSHGGHPASGAGLAVADRALSEEEL
jgi:hypothetical protein